MVITYESHLIHWWHSIISKIIFTTCNTVLQIRAILPPEAVFNSKNSTGWYVQEMQKEITSAKLVSCGTCAVRSISVKPIPVSISRAGNGCIHSEVWMGFPAATETQGRAKNEWKKESCSALRKWYWDGGHLHFCSHIGGRENTGKQTVPSRHPHGDTTYFPFINPFTHSHTQPGIGFHLSSPILHILHFQCIFIISTEIIKLFLSFNEIRKILEIKWNREEGRGPVCLRWEDGENRQAEMNLTVGGGEGKSPYRKYPGS